MVNVTELRPSNYFIEEGNIYIALKGERFDGHNFVKQAVEKGACAVIVNAMSKVPDNAVGIVVKDTLKALGDLAEHYRFKIGAKVIAVTGSVGKTTTRDMITAALETSFKVWSTKKNLNNDIADSGFNRHFLLYGDECLSSC